MALATARELKFCFTESISVTFLKEWCPHKQTQVFQCLVVHQCFVDHFFVRRFRSIETHSLFPLFSIDSRPNTSSVPKRTTKSRFFNVVLLVNDTNKGSNHSSQMSDN